MSEPTTTEPTETTEPTGQKQGDPAEASLGEGGKKALDAERRARQAAEKSAADFKKRLDEIEAANLSELDKAKKQAQEAQEAATRAAADASRFRIAAKHGINDEDADLFLTATDPETLERQAAALVARTPASPKADPSQGAKGSSGSKTTADSFAEFFRNNL
jgi:hypothetical protein